MLDTLEIMKRIPHRYPFLLVDRIIEVNKEEQKIKGLKNVTCSATCLSVFLRRKSRAITRAILL